MSIATTTTTTSASASASASVDELGDEFDKLEDVPALEDVEAKVDHTYNGPLMKLDGKYYRFLAKAMIHHGYQWREGLNEDVHPFNTNRECGQGGLYFCEESEINQWHTYGELVADVTLPADAKVCHYYYKSKANKVIISNIRSVWELGREIPEFMHMLLNSNRQVPDGYMAPELQRAFNEKKFMKRRIRRIDDESQKLFEDLLEKNPEFWRTVFHSFPLYYLRCQNKTQEMANYLSYKSGYGVSLNDIPAEHRTPEVIAACIEADSSNYRYAPQDEKQSWELVHRSSRFIEYVLEPTREMIDYVVDTEPTNIRGVSVEFVTEDDFLKCVPKLDKWDANGMARRMPRLALKHMKLFNEEQISDARVAMVEKIVCEFVRQAPLVAVVIDEFGGRVYGSFARWTIRTALYTGAVPTIEELYKFLEKSDIDIHISRRGFKFRKFYELIRTMGGRMEFSGFEEYNQNVGYHQPSGIGSYSVGHYHVWIPSDRVASSWLKFDFMLGTTGVGSPDYSVNSTIIYKCLRVQHETYNDLMNMVIRPDGLHHRHLAKQVIRAGKLLQKGYTLAPKTKNMFRNIIAKVDRKPINTIVCIEDTSKPSIDEPMQKGAMIPLTKYTLVPLTRKMFNEAHATLAIREWLDEPEPVTEPTAVVAEPTAVVTEPTAAAAVSTPR